MPRLSPVNQARWARSAIIAGATGHYGFPGRVSLSLCAELIANDKPLLVRYEGQWYFRW